jgi:hypothetical protein
VYAGKPFSDDIQDVLGIGVRQYQKGLKVLCDCNALKKVSRGVYQVNPTYAGRGEWKYNPKLNRGGVEDLVATFNFATGEVNTKIVWADNGEDTEYNDTYRNGLGVNKEEQAVLKTREYVDTRVMCGLSANSYKILSFLTQIMTRDNCFEIGVEALYKTLKMSKPTAIKGIKDLKETNCIALVKNKSRKQANTYMINPMLLQGTKENTELIERYIEISGDTEIKDFSKEYAGEETTA